MQLMHSSLPSPGVLLIGPRRKSRPRGTLPNGEHYQQGLLVEPCKQDSIVLRCESESTEKRGSRDRPGNL